jgi:hypothetical protein
MKSALGWKSAMAFEQDLIVPLELSDKTFGVAVH